MKPVDISNEVPSISEKHIPINSDDQEDHIINLAYDVLEERLRKREASAAEICAVLKMGSRKERLEQEIMKRQASLLEAKIDAMESAKIAEARYNEVLKALKSYQGYDDYEDVY